MFTNLVYGTVCLLLNYVGVKQGCVICSPILLCIILIITQFGAPAKLGGKVTFKNIFCVFCAVY